MATDVSPTFTIALRGYDKDQVDHYLENLCERTSETDNELFDLQEQSRYLETEHQRLGRRIEELEGAIRSETPHTVAALGERITLILTEAEEGAADTISQAEARADYVLGEAQLQAERLRQEAASSEAEARETLVAAQRQAEILAERIEAEGRTKAASIANDAELRARRRHEQIESWAQEVIANTQSEQAQLIEEFAKIRRHHEAQVQSLLGERDDAIAALRSLQGSLSRAVERIPVEPRRAAGAPIPAPSAVRPEIGAAKARDLVTDGDDHGATVVDQAPAEPAAPTRLTWAPRPDDTCADGAGEGDASQAG